MKMKFSYVRYLEVSAECPTCGKQIGADMGDCTVADLQPSVDFWCGEHGMFSLPINWGDEINKLISQKRDGR